MSNDYIEFQLKLRISTILLIIYPSRLLQLQFFPSDLQILLV